ncbi:adenylyl-sulfate kinase [Desertihabitans brevis]|uniref:Gluconokinase n=1 Tax=Desertihabitans brevis TaxID=2268447 RepID=A0A367YT01_9ACTN|nr:gluconokinase, GntK/IdnK-type [Desertihabitans brevis]RCK68152.1 adenylyl-sulfate kinase [Desertihabitans brevis]
MPAAPPVRRIVVMGVQGSGKTTIGHLLGERLGWRFVDGDTLHSDEARARMAGGTPLTDEDRHPWLERVGQVLGSQAPVVVGCSALRRRYRDQLRRHAPDAVMVHGHADPELLAARVAGRQHEYMPPQLLQSQLETLEPLQDDEAGIVVDVDARPDDIVTDVIRRLGLRPDPDGPER